MGPLARKAWEKHFSEENSFKELLRLSKKLLLPGLRNRREKERIVHRSSFLGSNIFRLRIRRLLASRK